MPFVRLVLRRFAGMCWLALLAVLDREKGQGRGVSSIHSEIKGKLAANRCLGGVTP